MAKAGRYRVCTTFYLGLDAPKWWDDRNRYFKTLAGLRNHLLKAIGEDFSSIFVEDQEDPLYPNGIAQIPSYAPGPELAPEKHPEAIHFIFEWLNQLLGDTEVQDAWMAKFVSDTPSS